MGNLNTEKIAVFHIGRGGRYYNGGYKTFKCFANSFDAEYFGVNVFEVNGNIIDEAGDVVCTVEEYNSNKGTLDIDGEYNTYVWLPIADIDEDDLKLIYRDGGGHELFYILEQPEGLKILMELEAKLDDLVWCIIENLTKEITVQ